MPARASPRLVWNGCCASYFLQQWFDLSAPGAEEALYDSLAMRRWAAIDLGRKPVPDETTVCKFRHLLERHDLGLALFEQVHAYPEQRGLKLSRGTIVDGTIIDASRSSKNAHRLFVSCAPAGLLRV